MSGFPELRSTADRASNGSEPYAAVVLPFLNQETLKLGLHV